jgi:predicted transcriptional regulator
MAKELFEFDDYKALVNARFQAAPRGEKQRLAKFIGCQDSYVSLVLAGDRHFSIEQAEATARYLHLDDEETEFFLLLVNLARAATRSLRSYFERQISARRRARLNLRRRMEISAELSDADKMVYYGDILFAKIHMCVTLEGEWTISSLSDRFRVDSSRVAFILRFLTERGFVRARGSVYEGANKYLFLDKNSPFLSQHHANFRLDSLQAARAGSSSTDNVHLSLAVTMSETHVEELKRRIAQFIEQTSALIKKSPEEKLMMFNLDFYEG